jgi:RNA polymerase sigma-70 factor, ECF subfamily
MTVIPDRNQSLNPDGWLDQYGDYLFRYAIFRLRDRAAAEDAVQEALLAAMESRERFDGRSSERTWLIGILKHKIIDQYRQTARAKEIPLEADTDFNPFEKSGEWVGHWRAEVAPTSWQAEAAAAFERMEFWETFARSLARLPQKTAAAFVMREIDGFSSEEICEVLDLSRENLWVMLHRARLKLRDALDAEWFRGKRSFGRLKPDSNVGQHSGIIAGKHPGLSYFAAAA